MEQFNFRAAFAAPGDGEGAKKKVPIYILAALLGAGATWAAIEARVSVHTL